MRTRVVLHIPGVDGQVTGIWNISVLVLEITDNESKYSIGGFAALLHLLLPLEVFGDDDSKISLLFSYWQLLVGHGVVSIYIVVSNLRHCQLVICQH